MLTHERKAVLRELVGTIKEMSKETTPAEFVSVIFTAMSEVESEGADLSAPLEQAYVILGIRGHTGYWLT